ncbi:isopenicillin n acyltransferase [Colletotrichum chrysophilum]|uniref:Isopenicillin n acyltransferase n=1 Tax=Colletotrichum chrysophilum TaxID=1836956 RepID=A0AAD9EDN8_9PEZI|nr:isopenicillin n acyltransferase [Colletotrichum chrysophilum]
MLDITVTGNHHEIGLAVGQQAAAQVAGSIDFYRVLFKAFNDLEWSTVRERTLEFVPHLKAKFPRYYEEMEGIAEGAGVDILDVVALNIRSEIAFGLFEENSRRPMAIAAVDAAVDGCTTLGWKTPGGSTFLSQNWDWKSKQKPNIIILRVKPRGVPDMDLPAFQMITEAGIIGKIGFNEHGVGCLLNGIRAKGVDPERMPIHFALPWDWPEDSPKRTARMQELATPEVGKEAGFDTLLELFKDEQNFPASINRKQFGNNDSNTIFNVVYNLTERKGVISIGRRTEIEEQIEIGF